MNYNKFEYRNPYRLRLEDFVNESTIQKIISGLGSIFAQSRQKYAAIFEDVAEGWNLSSTLTYIGLGVLAPIKAITPAAASEDNKELFAALQVFQLLYSWVYVNCITDLAPKRQSS